MNVDEFHAMVIQGSGPLAQLQPARAARLTDYVLRSWPESAAGLVNDRTTFTCDVANSVGRSFRREYGFSPIALLILGGIINFLIEWYFAEPAQHRLVISQLRAIQISAASAGGEIEDVEELVP